MGEQTDGGIVRARMIHDFRDSIFVAMAIKDSCAAAANTGNKPIESCPMIHLHTSHSPTTTQLPTRSDKPVATPEPVDSAELKMIQQLRARDLEVRSHEQAHVAAAGSLAQGGPSFQFTRGPDGRLYATGGEVGIDVSPVANDPHATIEKAQQIRRAALAPSNPSQADRAVAARATAMITEARAELQRNARDAEAPLEVVDKADDGHEADGLLAHFATNSAERSPQIDLTI